MNRIIITGNTGKEPEVKHYGDEGKRLVKFSVAVKEGYGENATITWFNVVSFRSVDFIEEHITKGSKVAVEGRMTSRQSDEGLWYWELNADSVELLHKKEDPTPFEQPE